MANQSKTTKIPRPALAGARQLPGLHGSSSMAAMATHAAAAAFSAAAAAAAGRVSGRLGALAGRRATTRTTRTTLSTLAQTEAEAEAKTDAGAEANPKTVRHSNRGGRNQAPRRGGRSTNYQLRQYAEATLGGGSLRKVVKLPEGEDENEWYAVNMVDFYNQINLLYGAITEFCSPKSCPEMKATDEFEYLWQDNENFKKPTKMAAPAYIEQLMTWVQNNIDNEQVLPSRIGVPFSKSFPSLVKQIFKRMYRVYAHIYCHHYPVVRELGLEPHLNTSFKQYVLFIDEHRLGSGRDYWGPLGDLVESMLRSD